MAFKRPLSVSPLPQETNSRKITQQAKHSSEFRLCRICGDRARIINYGALSCQSCKTFFRRNGFHSESGRPCQFNGSCEVNIKTRRGCTACRLAKCISMGMSSDLIRKEDLKNTECPSPTKANNNEPTVLKRPMSVSQLPLLKLMRDDYTSMSTPDWTSLSNIVYAYDAFSTIPQIRRTVEQLAVSSNEVCFDVKTVLDLSRSMFTSMQSFVNSVPDFQILTTNEQNSLLERNLYGVAGLCSILVIRDSGLSDNSKYWETFETIYGYDMTVNTKRINKQLDHDSTIIKIMLIVFAFSSNCLFIDTHENIHNDRLLFGTHRLLGSQNAFVELLWKYMIYRYGFYDTVHRFARLIKLLLDLMKYSAMNYGTNMTHRNLVDKAMEKAKEMLIVNQNEHVSLWGKI